MLASVLLYVALAVRTMQPTAAGAKLNTSTTTTAVVVIHCVTSPFSGPPLASPHTTEAACRITRL